MKSWPAYEIDVAFSNPTRTILDMLVEPAFAGGIRSAKDMLGNYLKSRYKNLKLLIDYGDRLGNGSVFKRLGFLLETTAPDEAEVM